MNDGCSTHDAMNNNQILQISANSNGNNAEYSQLYEKCNDMLNKVQIQQHLNEGGNL